MNQLYFIHIGKCSGTTIRSLFNLQVCHLRKPNPRPNQRILIWVRNPFSRMVSAFNYQKAIVEFDVDLHTVDEIKKLSLAPVPLIRKKLAGRKYLFNQEFDTLMSHFRCHNHLFESLSSSNLQDRSLAQRLISLTTEHFHKGIGWYLDNGRFVERHRHNILFVGRTEHIEEDVAAFFKVIGREHVSAPKRRSSKGKSSISLSATAITNLSELFERSEFKALKVLKEQGLLPAETFRSYLQPGTDCPSAG